MINNTRAETSVIRHADRNFDITLLKVNEASQCILFAAGAGGSPLRHLELLQTFSHNGISVVAPHFERLTSSTPSKADLLERSQRLALARDAFCQHYASITGIGHSLGTVILLMHAGAKAWTRTGEKVTYAGRQDLNQLVLLAPPADFFRAPSALASVKVPVRIWTGEKDTLTPPSQALFIKEELDNRTETELSVVKDAGHFTFMNILPPHITDTHPSRDAFLLNLGEEIARFVTGLLAQPDNESQLN
ncbi:alpha/beta hydrolase [Pantoea agglomerans]|uniref:alpha/beta hydrolase n=1 Tax=Enterobacter agglomerans TaxID=549 RepID=UPI003C7D5B37